MKRLSALLAFCGAPVLACEPGATLVFQCDISSGRKHVQICATPHMVQYRFGQTGQIPELTLDAPVPVLDVRPWNGIGRYLYEQVSFHNDAYTYTVYSSLDRLTQEARLEGGIAVEKEGESIAQLRCDRGRAEGDLYELSVLKQATGLCWSHTAFEWTASCPPQ